MTFRRAVAALLLSVACLLLLSPPARAQPADQAKVSAALNLTALQPGQDAVVAVVLNIQRGFHAQSHTPKDPNWIALTVTAEASSAVKFGDIIFPPGHDENYPALGLINVYTGKVIVYVPFKVADDAKPGPLTIKGTIRYQICDDNSCFGSETKPWSVETKVVAKGEAVSENQPDLFKNFDPSVFARTAAPAVVESTKIGFFGKELDLGGRSYLLAFALAFVVGIIFNAVPCVLPVLPLKAIGFYEVSQHNRAKSLALGAVFSLGLIASFAVLGLIVLLGGKAWGELFGNAWFLGGIVVVLTVLAFSMFGTFTVGLPRWVYAVTPRHDTYTGNFLMGILTAALSTPCTFGMFLGLLVWAAKQPPVLGTLLVTTVGVGMAFPYFILSAFPQLARRFPRTGPWAEIVKQMMGFLLLVSAVYFARRFLEAWLGDKAYWWALFAVILAAGIFLIARTNHFAKSATPRIVGVVVALLFVVPSLLWVWRVTHPPIDWKPYSVAALDEARKTGRPVMVEFTAAWCGNCIALETTVFHDPETVKALKEKDVLTLRADLTQDTAPGWPLLKQVSRVGAIPLTAIYLPGANEPVTLGGLYSTPDLVGVLKRGKPAPAIPTASAR
jgi:thiol:disulfide interchange protein DsbD